MARYRFWFHDKNKKGQPLDESVLKAAEEIAPSLTRYRQHEIDNESTTNDILQSAVEAASDATRKKPIANPAGYLVSVYRRFVDKFLDQHKKLMPVDDEFLEDLANAEHSPSFEEWMHNRLILEQLLKLMDPDTRRICRWRLEGYSESEIAERLGITANAVSFVSHVDSRKPRGICYEARSQAQRGNDARPVDETRRSSTSPGSA